MWFVLNKIIFFCLKYTDRNYDVGELGVGVLLYNQQHAFDKNLATMNVTTLRIGSYLIVFNVAIFWVLDWFIFPQELLLLTAGLRAVPIIFAAFLWYLTLYKKSFAARNNFKLILTLTFITALVTSIKCWIIEGPNSQYFIAICMMMAAIAVNYTWKFHHALIFISAMYVAYLAPLIYFDQFLPFSSFLTNQAFFFGFAMVTLTGQINRLAKEKLRFEQKLSNRRSLAYIRKLATTDSLTGLKNRHYLFDVAGREVDRCIRHKRNLAVLILDLDYFKQINDDYGHAEGDKILKYIGQLLTKSVRTIDIACRYGGEEFVVVMPDISFEDAVYTVVNRIHQQMHTNPITILDKGNSKTIFVTASIGVSKLKDSTDDLKSIIQRADEFLYQAKENGRNQTAFDKENLKKVDSEFKAVSNS